MLNSKLSVGKTYAYFVHHNNGVNYKDVILFSIKKQKTVGGDIFSKIKRTVH